MVYITPLTKDKLETESNTEYIQRLCNTRQELDMTWKELSDHLNSILKLDYSDSWYRKNYKDGNFDVVSSFTTTSATSITTDDEDSYDDVDSKLHKLALKKIEVSDLITQNNAYVRRLSREQTIKDIAHDYAITMNKGKILDSVAPVEPIIVHNEGILLLSDWHYGMVCDNPWNKFDPDICKTRVNKLLREVLRIINTNEIYHVTVLDLADLIAGRIHTQIRIESRFDVITQTMEVAEILAEFLTELSKHCEVSFYSCLDNHSRLEPNKKESMDLESLARLIPWYLRERLSSNPNVAICENKYGAGIITCTVAGHNIVGVHGDNDPPNTALERLSLMTQKHYDLLCTAHLHHFSMDERHMSMIVSNSTLMGVDRYAEKLRVSSEPSQTFILATPENVCQAVYRIVLK